MSAPVHVTVVRHLEFGIPTTVRFGLSTFPENAGIFYEHARQLTSKVADPEKPVYVEFPFCPRMQLTDWGAVAAPYARLNGPAEEEALASVHRGQWEDGCPDVLIHRVYPVPEGITVEQKASNAAFWRDSVHAMLGPAWGKRVLDLGCGVGRVLDLVADAQELAAGIDISESMLRVAADRLYGRASLYKGSGWSLPFPAASFDGIYSTLCLQHLSPLTIRERYLKEIRRVLAPGGRAALQFKLMGYATSWWYDRPDYAGLDVSFLSPEEGAVILALYGFRVVASFVTDTGGSEDRAQWWWTSLEVI